MRRFSFLLVLLFAFLILGGPNEQRSDTSFDVRVLLVDGTDDSFEAILDSNDGFIVRVPSEKIQQTLPQHRLKLTVRKGRLAIDGRLCVANRIEILPVAETARLNGGEYAGRFIFLRQEEHVYLINRVDVEEYLFCVLRWEGWPGWSDTDEMYRVLALVCRTFVVFKSLETRNSRKHRRPYDIKATQAHQVYKGRHNHFALRDMVDQTRGQILVFNGKPVNAMYCACCGGTTPSKMSGINFTVAPYLRRTQPCTFCTRWKTASWQKTYPLSSFGALIEGAKRHGLRVVSVRVQRTDRSGYVQTIQVLMSNGRWYAVSARSLTGKMPGILSHRFTLSVNGNKVRLSGRGHGHGFGLCEAGAYEMIQRGNDFNDVLRFYYKGATLGSLKVVKSST